MTALAAVVDVGSNSVRLLLFERMAPDGAVGQRVVTVTGLGRGAAPDGAVSSEALKRLDACLASYAERIIGAGGPPVVAVGTAAVREAPNRDAIAAVVRQRLATELVVVPGEREAALAFAGARLALPSGAGPCRVIDIGGASTEVVEGDASGPRSLVSLPLGVVRQAGRTPEAARREAERLVRAGAGGFATAGPVVGVAGTVTQVAAIHAGEYDPEVIHRMGLTRADIQSVLDRVTPLADAARRAVPGMHPDRTDVIVNGAAILLGVLDGLGADAVIVSERDLLDGICLDPSLVAPAA